MFPNTELRPYKEIKSGIFLKIGNKTPAGVSERLPMLMACYVIKSTSYFYSDLFLDFDMFFSIGQTDGTSLIMTNTYRPMNTELNQLLVTTSF